MSYTGSLFGYGCYVARVELEAALKGYEDVFAEWVRDLFGSGLLTMMVDASYEREVVTNRDGASAIAHLFCFVNTLEPICVNYGDCTGSFAIKRAVAKYLLAKGCIVPTSIRFSLRQAGVRVHFVMPQICGHQFPLRLTPTSPLAHRVEKEVDVAPSLFTASELKGICIYRPVQHPVFHRDDRSKVHAAYLRRLERYCNEVVLLTTQRGKWYEQFAFNRSAAYGLANLLQPFFADDLFALFDLTDLAECSLTFMVLQILARAIIDAQRHDAAFLFTEVALTDVRQGRFRAGRVDALQPLINGHVPTAEQAEKMEGVRKHKPNSFEELHRLLCLIFPRSTITYKLLDWKSEVGDGLSHRSTLNRLAIVEKGAPSKHLRQQCQYQAWLGGCVTESELIYLFAAHPPVRIDATASVEARAAFMQGVATVYPRGRIVAQKKQYTRRGMKYVREVEMGKMPELEPAQTALLLEDLTEVEVNFAVLAQAAGAL